MNSATSTQTHKDVSAAIGASNKLAVAKQAWAASLGEAAPLV